VAFAYPFQHFTDEWYSSWSWRKKNFVIIMVISKEGLSLISVGIWLVATSNAHRKSLLAY
jgi:hypothetical protein